jgi:hypothetical protein
MITLLGKWTTVAAINRVSIVIGSKLDANGVSHGFIRRPNGKMLQFTAPGAGTHYPLGTFPASINANGEIAGSYVDNNNVTTGFIRIR